MPRHLESDSSANFLDSIVTSQLPARKTTREKLQFDRRRGIVAGEVENKKTRERGGSGRGSR